MKSYPVVLILAGALASAAIGVASSVAHGPRFVASIRAAAEQARDRAGGRSVTIDFTMPQGWLTRHPTLSGGENLDPATRARVSAAIAGAPGIGGVGWSATRRRGGTSDEGPDGDGLHCQGDVEAILKVRSIRFSEASAAIDPASEALLDEVASALRPCLGSIIAITGHTDTAGDEEANIALSRARAEAVRWALIGRGIPADGLRAAGKGAHEPLEGLDPDDPANRRIEFSVIETVPLRPTPVDTPGPG